MSTLVQVTGILEEPTQLLLPDANANDVLELDAGDTRTLVVHGIIIVNKDTDARVCNVWLTKGSTDRLIYSGSVAADGTETEALKYPIKMVAKSEARKIMAQAESATGDTVTVTLITSFAQQSGAAR